MEEIQANSRGAEPRANSNSHIFGIPIPAGPSIRHASANPRAPLGGKSSGPGGRFLVAACSTARAWSASLCSSASLGPSEG